MPLRGTWAERLSQGGVSIGSALDNDWILLDSSWSRAVLRHQDGGWVLEADGQAMDTAEPGTDAPLLDAGGVAVGVFAPAAAWLDPRAATTRLQAERARRARAAAAPTAPPANEVEDTDSTTEPLISAVAAATAATASTAQPSSTRPMAGSGKSAPLGAAPGVSLPWYGNARALLVMGALACFGVTALVWMLHSPDKPASRIGVAGSASAEPIAAKAVAQQAALTAARAVLKQRGLEASAQADLSPEGRVRVTVKGLDDEALEGVALALSRLNPRPALRVLGQEDSLLAVTDVLLSLDDTLSARSADAGRIRIEGQVASAAARDALQAKLQQQFPSQRFDWAVTTPDQTAKLALDALRAEGFEAVSGQWDGQALQLQGRLAAADMPRWERALASLNQQYGQRLAINAQVRVAADAPSASAGANRLPFGVRSVVSGPSPYLVTQDGQKIMLGGSVQGWRLVDIDASRITLDGPRRLVVTRE
jgi:type III secretion protein D